MPGDILFGGRVLNFINARQNALFYAPFFFISVSMKKYLTS